MLFLLFGPPGVGKSTLCEKLSAVDFECFNDLNTRLEYAKEYIKRPGIHIAGAADLNSNNFPQACYIALTMDEDSYRERRASRDKLFKEKADQEQMTIDVFVKSLRDVDISVDASGGINDTLQSIMSAISDYCKRYGLKVVLTCSDARRLNQHIGFKKED